MPDDLTMEQFCSWLCNHEDEVVGHAGRCFANPLAEWLSHMIHATIGVEDARYGRASLPWWQWKCLPQWATVFLLRSENCASFQPITGLDALCILADVECSVSH